MLLPMRPAVQGHPLVAKEQLSLLVLALCP